MDGEPGMRIAGLAKAGAVALLLAQPAAAETIEDAACAQAKTWATTVRRHVGLHDYLDRWRCDVVERLEDGTWRVAGLYGQQGRDELAPFVIRLYGPILERFGFCDLALGKRGLPVHGPADQCERPAAEPSEAGPPA